MKLATTVTGMAPSSFRGLCQQHIQHGLSYGWSRTALPRATGGGRQPGHGVVLSSRLCRHRRRSGRRPDQAGRLEGTRVSVSHTHVSPRLSDAFLILPRSSFVLPNPTDATGGRRVPGKGLQQRHKLCKDSDKS